MSNGRFHIVVLFFCLTYLSNGQPLGASELPISFDREIGNTNIVGVSESDLRHGERQLHRMIHDRPRMLGYLTKGDSAYEWVVRQFAGEHTGYRIYWNRKKTAAGNLGENHYKYGSRKAMIRVSSLNPMSVNHSGEKLWGTAIFELLNIRNGPSFYKAYSDANEGRLSLNEWVVINTKLEFEAYKKANDFYKQIWLPLMDSKKIESRERAWTMIVADTHEQWMNSRNGLPYVNYWKNCYPGISAEK